MTPLPAIFALIVAAAGVYYLVFSHAATRLATVEAIADNRRRVRLRRFGGVAMILLAGCFYGIFPAVDHHLAGVTLLLMAATVILLALVVMLGLIDLRLTRQLQRPPEDQE